MLNHVSLKFKHSSFRLQTELEGHYQRSAFLTLELILLKNNEKKRKREMFGKNRKGKMSNFLTYRIIILRVIIPVAGGSCLKKSLS